MTTLENHTFDQIAVGQSATYERTLTERDIVLFAEVSGDVNPAHLDAEYAKTTPFKDRIAHGMWTGALISAAIALKLPGPGTIYLGQTLSFRAPVKIGDTITVRLEVTEKRVEPKKKVVVLACEAKNQDGKVVASGVAEVIAPSETMSREAPKLPKITVGA